MATPGCWQLWRDWFAEPPGDAQHSLHGKPGIGHEREKQELAKRTDAVAVDMETYAAAQAAEAHGVPWLAVRVVRYGVDESLPFI